MRKIFALAVALALLVAASPAWATTVNWPSPFYVYTSASNTTLVSTDYLLASSVNDGTLLTDATVSWQIQPGDGIGIQWFDRTGTQISSSHLDTSNTTATGVDVTPPSNAYAAKLVLITGSGSGDRYVWWHTSTNSLGVVTIYPDPTVSQPPPNSGGTTPTSGGGGSVTTSTTTNVDMSGVIDAINAVGGQLSTIINNQGTMITQLDDVKGKLDTVISTLGDMDSYLTTPRQSQSLDTSALGDAPTFDPTPPPVTEPPQQPYTYDRQTPQMPPYVDSPGPLPVNPDPVAMAHDPPAQVDPPATMDQPRTPDPVHVDAPLTPNQPLSITPPHMDAPLTPDPVHMDAPLTPQTPAQPQQPLTPDVPLSPQPALTPQPPLTPQ